MKNLTLFVTVLFTSLLVSCGGNAKKTTETDAAATEPATEQVCNKACCGCEGCLCEDQTNCPECCPEGCPCDENCGKCCKDEACAGTECCKNNCGEECTCTTNECCQKACAEGEKGECCKEGEKKAA